MINDGSDKNNKVNKSVIYQTTKELGMLNYYIWANVK